MKRLRLFAVVSALAALVAVPSAYAAGLWWGLPWLGGPTYCVSYAQANALATTPNVLLGTNATCVSRAPAGPTAFNGTEMVPADIVGNVDRPPSSVYINITQLGNGPVFNQNPVGTTQTIPDFTPFYLIGGAQGSALTVTMPPNPVDGQIQRIVCVAATVGTVTAVANTGQTVNNGVAAQCAVGTGYAWRYVVASAAWIRYQ